MLQWDKPEIMPTLPRFYREAGSAQERDGLFYDVWIGLGGEGR